MGKGEEQNERGGGRGDLSGKRMSLQKSTGLHLLGETKGDWTAAEKGVAGGVQKVMVGLQRSREKKEKNREG